MKSADDFGGAEIGEAMHSATGVEVGTLNFANADVAAEIPEI